MRLLFDTKTILLKLTPKINSNQFLKYYISNYSKGKEFFK